MSTLRSLCAGVIAAILVAGFSAPADAAPPEVPSQEEWQAAKRTVELPNGQRIAYLDLGDPARPALILLHGFTDSSRTWSMVAAELAQHRRLIVPDLRGHGSSASPACCYRYADLVEDVLGLADSLGVSAFDLAGHSMGSMVGQHIAAQEPRRVRSLALIGSTVLAPLEPGGDLDLGLQSIAEPLDPSRNAFLADWLKQGELVPPQPAFTAPWRAELLAVPAFVWHRSRETFVAGPIGADLSAISAPVLTLSGGADPLFGPPHLAALPKAFPKGRHCVLRDGGHNPPYEAPDWTAARLSAFLAGRMDFADCG